jgi:PAS domain S-box-containing protein
MTHVGAGDNEVFERLADSLNHAILVTRKFKPLYANQAFAELFGYSDAREILALDCVDVLIPDDSMQIMRGYHKARYRGDPAPNDYVIQGRRKDGQLIWLQNRPMRMEWAGGLAVCTTMTDVTRQVEAEQALKASEETYRRLFENSPEGIFRTSLDAKLLEANPALAQMIGFETPDELKASVNDFGREFYVDHKVRRELVKKMEAEGQIKDYQVQWRRRDGSVIWVSLSSALVRDATTGSVFFEGTAVDITDRHNAAQSLLFAKDQAEMASRAKSEFLAHMSHELRTPLNCVIGFSQILMEEMFGPLGGENYKGYAKDINVAGNHLLNLISDILDISKIEAGELELTDERVDVGSILVSCMKMMREHADNSGLIISIEFAHDLPDIFADELRIKQIILNLLSNAIKFTKVRGRVTAGAFIADDGGVVLRVSDTGVGIPIGEIERVLSPFEQVREHHMLSHEGTGLGLFLTKALAEMHGGRLQLESQQGEGTEVSIYLPPERTLTPERS